MEFKGKYRTLHASILSAGPLDDNGATLPLCVLVNGGEGGPLPGEGRDRCLPAIGRGKSP